MSLCEKLKNILDNSECNNEIITISLEYNELVHLYAMEKGYKEYMNTLDKEMMLAFDKLY